jgi:hypothetical protein
MPKGTGDTERAEAGVAGRGDPGSGDGGGRGRGLGGSTGPPRLRAPPRRSAADLVISSSTCAG